MAEALDAELRPGEYRIAPSEKLRTEYGVPLGDVLSGDFEFLTEADDEPFHKYDIQGPDGSTALHVLEGHGKSAVRWLPFDLPQYVYLFTRPDGETRFVVEIDHNWYPSYTILEAGTTNRLGRVRKSRRVVGSWQLRLHGSGVAATANRVDTLTNLFSFSTHATYDVTGPDGADLGEFERERAEGDFTDQFRSAMTVDWAYGDLSVELALAFAFALLNQGEQSTSSGPRGL